MAVGISMMAGAFPSGWLADKIKRHIILRLSVLFGIIGLVAFATQMFFNLPYQFLYIASIFLGTYWGTYQPAFESLFADSIPPGQSKYYTTRYVFSVLSFALGYLLTTISFLVLGNQWKLEYLKYNLYLGLALMLPGLMFLCLMSDVHTIDYSAQGSSNESGDTQTSNGAQRTDGQEGSPKDAIPQGLPSQEQLKARDNRIIKDKDLGGKKKEKMDEENAQSLQKGLAEIKLANRAIDTSWYCNKFIPKIILRIGFIPFSILTSDIINALASGMSFKFFSLFFINQVQLQPIYVFAMAVVSCVSVSVLMKVSEYIATSVGVGKVKVQMVSRTLDVLLLMALAWLPTNYEVIKHFLVAVHVLRMGMANCQLGLVKALLMQYTPKEVRARWNALDSITSFSWSGSAAIGGILSQTIGYQNMFQVTALVKLLAILPIVPLFFLLPDGDGKLYTGPDRQLLEENASLNESLIQGDLNDFEESTNV